MSTILPGATLGVLGSGQLGRMFAIAARRLGYRVEVYSPDQNTPAGEVANHEWVGAYDDFDQLAKFAEAVDVVTLEFENVSVAAVKAIEHFAPVRPGANVLHTAQHRSREKNWLKSQGIPTAPFAIVRSREELADAIDRPGIDGQGILKTASWGYDGKGQVRVRRTDDLAAAWNSLATDEAVLEGIVDFERELSVVGVRGLQGDFRVYGPIHNIHRNHILDVSICPPAVLDVQTRGQAVLLCRQIMEGLDAVGILCVELFVRKNGQLVVNELAPRPHNSGHLTIDAFRSCQFEQQVRAVCGLPLGSTEQLRPAAMANLLGDVWEAPGGPNWTAALGMPNVKLHLYGKAEPRTGRKMGHLTALAETPELAEEMVRKARERLWTKQRD
ncbi:N5-carboxyaminoimidazole ribonucleotide synthase [Caulifigura coniformis]|uniref:N5-carboxyaminoimidazole ribonucleotide synthase n=1 Tax=Caulifigura coniformis TaxID=2527983 RepID=A0A517S9Q5_9PLAN|nr:5-(carboxyamino)imidazole ribonucleotide synthase [Caulifigura coniformis]QDT52860.1 N5-carboxyaminoimidazole ribonucleotide synthase [Caulifigura coniformis]